MFPVLDNTPLQLTYFIHSSLHLLLTFSYLALSLYVTKPFSWNTKKKNPKTPLYL